MNECNVMNIWNEKYKNGCEYVTVCEQITEQNEQLWGQGHHDLV